jgi:hypothetical protein
VKNQVEVFWVVTLCSVTVGYRRFGEACFHGPPNLRNVGISPHYTASHPRRPELEFHMTDHFINIGVEMRLILKYLLLPYRPLHGEDGGSMDL